MAIPFTRCFRNLAVLAGLWGAAPLPAAPAPKRILILGGTHLLGPAIVEAAQARGHQVTLFNRGRTRPELFPHVEKLQGDRDPGKGEGLKALEKGTWDAVIDNSGFYPRMVDASARLLAPRVKQYIYISSVSAYAEPNPVNGAEDAPLATMPDPAVESMGKNYENFGPLKALCEQAAEKAMPGRVAVVRPGYIVGPDDDTGRFAYWPARAARGGEMAVPGTPSDPIQIIDVRDLGAWLVKLVEDGTVGVFNAVGGEKPHEWGKVIDACVKAGGRKATPIYLSNAFLQTQQVDFPIWTPFEGPYKGLHTWSNAKAVAAGLRFRPLEETVRDTLAWFKGQEGLAKGRTRLTGPDAAAEARLLDAWRSKDKKEASPRK
jgi:2'-hydroxyisoflavone reductase